MQQRHQVKPITYLKSHAADLVREVSEGRRAVTITQNGEAKVVVLDVETYDAWREGMALLKILALSERDVAAGRLTPQDRVFERLDAALSTELDSHDE